MRQGPWPAWWTGGGNRHRRCFPVPPTVKLTAPPSFVAQADRGDCSSVHPSAQAQGPTRHLLANCVHVSYWGWVACVEILTLFRIRVSAGDQVKMRPLGWIVTP